MISISTEKVFEALHLLSGMSKEALSQYGPIVEAAASSVAQRVSDGASDKAIMLAAAKANYEIALSRASLGVTSFQAGDVSFSLSGKETDSAKALLESISASCSDILKDSGFSFKAV